MKLPNELCWKELNGVFYSDDPIISIYTPTYNRNNILRERAITSVLNQTYTNWEYIIIHDGLEDNGLREIIESYDDPRIRYFAIKRATPHHNHDSKKVWCIEGSNAANFALDQVRGDWIARLDDDDIWTKEHLEKSLRFAEKQHFQFISSKAKDIDSVYLNEYLRIPLDLVYVGPHSSWFYSAKLKGWKYDPECYKKEWNQVADVDLLERFAKAGLKIGYLNEELTIIKPRPGEQEIGLKAYIGEKK